MSTYSLSKNQESYQLLLMHFEQSLKALKGNYKSLI